MALAWAIGAGIGLSALAGFRVFVPLAVFILMARLGWVLGFNVQDTPLDFLQSNAAVIILLVMVAGEVLLIRLGSLAVIERALRLPLAVAAGGLLFPAALAGEASGQIHLLGIPAGVILSLLGFYIYRGLTLMGEGRDPGPALDISVLVLSVVMMLLPPAGFLFGLICIWLALRIRRIRKMKYKGLRVLA